MQPMPSGLEYDLQRGDGFAVMVALRGGVPVDARNEYGRIALAALRWPSRRGMGMPNWSGQY